MRFVNCSWKKHKGGKCTCSSLSWRQATLQACETCQVKLNQQRCVRMAHPRATY
jgi:hypothetical protein